MTDDNVSHSKGDDTTSPSLLNRVRQSDTSAWEKLVKLYAPLVYHWCRQSGLQDANSADIGQEVFKTVFASIGKFQHKPGGSFRGWLRSITRTRILDHFREQKRIIDSGVGGADTLMLDKLPDQALVETDTPADERVEEAMLYRRAIELILGEFPELTGKAFLQLVVDGLSPQDVAKELGLSMNQVYLAKSRVLRRLRTEFADIITADPVGHSPRTNP